MFWSLVLEIKKKLYEKIVESSNEIKKKCLFLTPLSYVSLIINEKYIIFTEWMLYKGM